MSIIDHVGLAVTDFGRSSAFYTAALGTLGMKPLAQFSEGGSEHAGYGKDRPSFWIGTGKRYPGEAHVAFVAGSRADSLYAGTMTESLIRISAFVDRGPSFAPALQSTPGRII